MAANTNTTSTLITIGNREDLEDAIYRVVAEETPFTSSIGTAKATAVYHEWQTETLAAPDATNAQLEGNQNFQNIGAPNLTTRVGNYTQIFTKVGEVTGTQEVVNAAGRSSEYNRQRVLKGMEMARDIEARFTGNYASNQQSGSTPRRAAGVLAWETTNVSRGSGGSNGGFSAGVVSAATNGTLRTLTGTLVSAVRQTGFTNGAKPSIGMMGGALKETFSTIPGIADIRATVTGNNQATIIAGADVYVDSFGQLSLVPHPYAFTREVLFYDPKYLAVGTLRAMKTEQLAKTGDATAFQIVAEKTLVVRNEKAHEVIADVQG